MMNLPVALESVGRYFVQSQVLMGGDRTPGDHAEAGCRPRNSVGGGGFCRRVVARWGGKALGRASNR